MHLWGLPLVGEDQHKAAAIALVAGWLKSDCCPCLFPRAIHRRLALTTVRRTDEIVSLLEGAFASAAESQKFALVILPGIDDADSLAQVLVRLAQAPRWTCREVTCGEGLLSLEMLWETESGPRSNAVGLGPFGFMPVTRRAPLTCLGLWPSAHANAFRKKIQPTVGLADTGHDLTRERYDDIFQKTRLKTGELVEAFQVPPTLRQTTFRLPGSYRDLFVPHLKPADSSSKS